MTSVQRGRGVVQFLTKGGEVVCICVCTVKGEGIKSLANLEDDIYRWPLRVHTLRMYA